MIKSISYDQHEILENIITLHTGPIDCDVTYGKGNFYKKLPQPDLCFDLDPRPEYPHVRRADVRHLPLDDAVVCNVIFDPPFMVNTGPGAILKDHFGHIGRNFEELWQFYFLALEEIYRVLRPGGWLIFKCQDCVNAGVNNFSHVVICNYAQAVGFIPKDLFILLAKTRMSTSKWREQRNARKYHSYFWVFQKRNGRNRHEQTQPQLD
jgi:SAM-dependent methyltransferase